jgi:hypothetical protein
MVFINGVGAQFVAGTSASVVNADLFANTAANGQSGVIDTSDSAWLALQLTGTWAGTVTPQGSYDGVSWVTLGALNVAGAVQIAGFTGNGIYIVQTPAPFTRLRVGTYTSGTMVCAGASVLPLADPFINPPTAVTATPANGTNYSLVAAATTNAAVVKSTGGNLYEITVSNQSAATVYVKLYNKATAPTVGTDTPIVTLPVAAASSINVEFGQIGKRFASGIGIAITANPAVTDATVIGTGVVVSGTYI